MKNVLFFIYRLYGGGAERVVSNLSLALDGNYNIKIVIYDREERTYPHKGELIRIKLPFSEDPTRNNKVQRFIRLLFLIRKLRNLKRIHGIDTCVSFGEQANIINVLSKRKERICLSMRTTLSKEMKNAPKMEILSSFISGLYNRADRIIVPSRLAAIDLTKWFHTRKDKIDVVYNYIDPSAISKLADEPITDPCYDDLFQKDILLHVGRITAAKGQWLLLLVLKKIKKDFPDVRLVLIGEGESEYPFKVKLLEYARNRGLRVFDKMKKGIVFSLDFDVYLLGFESNPFRYMRRSRILVFPSAYEGFPNTVIEAMQSRLPVIVADCASGPREILQPSSDPSIHTDIMEKTPFGILAPALPSSFIDDPVREDLILEWEKAIRLLLGNEVLRSEFINNGLRRASEFEKEIILHQWKSILFNDKG